MSHFDQSIVRSRIGSPLIIIMLLLSGMMAFFTFSGPIEVSGITVSGGELSGDTHWTVSESPVDVLDNITVPAGITLTIDPGIVVNLPPSIGIWVYGTIWAAGTDAAPIDFQKSHASYYFDGINITSGGYGYLDHILMTGSAGGVKAMGMGSRAYVYNSTLEGNAAGFRGMTGAFAWVVNCTFNAPLNVTARSFAEVHEGKWFNFKAVKDISGDPVMGVGIRVNGEKYPTELDEWTIYNSLVTGLTTGADGWMPPVSVNQYKHMGSTSSIRVEVTMEWFFQNESSSWEEDIKDPGLFVGDNFEIIWEMDWTPPSEPVNVTVGNRTGSSIELLWDIVDPPSDLKRFTIYYKKFFESDWTGIRYANYNKRSYIVDGLDEELEWIFQIRAEDFHPVYSEFVGPISGRTLDITPPHPVENFRSEGVGPDWGSFRWDASPSNDIIGFWLNITKKDMSWNNSYWIEGRTMLTANITGIDSETEYMAEITPVDDGEIPNFGNTSSMVEFTTQDNTPPVIPMLEFFPLDTSHLIPGSLYFNTSLVGFKVNVTGEDRTVIEIVLDGVNFVDPDGVIERWTTYDGVFQYYFFLSEGRHSARFRSIDPSGNMGEFNQTDIWVDLTPPEMNLVNVPGDRIEFDFGDTVNLSLNISDASTIHSVMWNVTNNDTSEKVEGTELSLELDVGIYDLSVTAYDIAGNWNTLSYDLVVSIPDTTPPGVIFNEPTDGDVNVGLGPAISLKFSEVILWDELNPQLFLTGGDMVNLRVVLDMDNRTITYYPDGSLLGETNYTFMLRNIWDLSGNRGDDITVQFTTISEDDIDGDGDGIPDSYELKHPSVLSPSDPSDAEKDYDNDGLSNLKEYQLGTEPDNVDSDDDGIPDGLEIDWGMDPTWPSDAQGDLDGDDYTNLEEYEQGSDPLDPESVPEAEEEGIGLYLIILILAIILVVAVVAIFVVILMKKRKEEEEEAAEEEAEKGSTGGIEEPTWSEQEELNKKECPFCKASLDEGMSYCPECGMTLPEDEVKEDSMDEDAEIEPPEEIPPPMDDDVDGGVLSPPSQDIPEPEDDMPLAPDEGMEPPSMEDGI